MSRHTSWHVGGPAEVFFSPRDRTELATFLRTLVDDVPIQWVGLGSNLLVRDGGLKGVVISTHGTLDRFDRLSQTHVYGEAGVACARIAKQCVKWGLGPAEFFAGIPGTLGGALAMNAGAFGGETWRHVVEVATIDRHGQERTRGPGEFKASVARASTKRRFAGCSSAAKPLSPSANGAVARCSPIHRAITPRVSSIRRV
jgi:UDP-N-acetylmuramate dehydrogenase